MIVTLIDVGQPQSVKTQRGSYQSLEVSYRNESGQVQGKKLMSFANPAVFKTIQEYVKDDRLDIETFKDDNGYWQWKNIAKEGEAPPKSDSSASTSKATTRVTGSNYETSDERAKRQVYIVRQSSIANAVNLLTAGSKSVKVDEVLSVAKQMEAYVFGTPSTESAPSIDDLSDDIPV
jgi:hypothetical protein|tara:strand:- start:8190 stop:8720 length:531 start_codon:yes stop_codon:yes gene_type:complete